MSKYSQPLREELLNFASQGYEKELEKIIPDEFYDSVQYFLADILYDRCYICQKKKSPKWLIITKHCQDYEICSNKCLDKFPKFPKYSKLLYKTFKKDFFEAYNHIVKEEKLKEKKK